MLLDTALLRDDDRNGRYRQRCWIPHCCGMTIGVSAIDNAAGYRTAAGCRLETDTIDNAAGYRTAAV